MVNLVGQRFGRLTVVERVKKTGKPGTRYRWKCRCECGGEKLVLTASLNSGTTKSCGCLWHEARLTQQEAETRDFFRQYVANAACRGHEYALSYDEFQALALGDCAYCGEPPARTRSNYYRRAGRVQTKFNGIDRIDNKLGYVRGNCVSCCRTCNYMKRDLSVSDFLNHITKISEFRLCPAL